MGSVVRFILILIVVFAVVLLAMRPDVFDDIWLWITGLIGLIVKLFEKAWDFLKTKFNPEPAAVPAAAVPQHSFQKQPEVRTPRNMEDRRTLADFPKPTFKGITLELKRLQDDGVSTLGALSIDGSFYCYTLEDTYREKKLKGETRIPAGEYVVDFNRHLTKMTQRYRDGEFYSEWFSFHLELKNVPGFLGVYIHNGGHHEHTDGCILVSTDYVEATDEKPVTFTNSRNTFKDLYIKLKEQLDKGVRVRIIITNETDFKGPNSSLS